MITVREKRRCRRWSVRNIGTDRPAARPVGALMVPTRPALLLVAAVAVVALAGTSSATARATTLSARPGRSQIRFRGSTTIAGKLSGNPTGNADQAVELRSDPYPYGSFTHVASTTTAPD